MSLPSNAEEGYGIRQVNQGLLYLLQIILLKPVGSVRRSCSQRPTAAILATVFLNLLRIPIMHACLLAS
jgi:hypothetical protein